MHGERLAEPPLPGTRPRRFACPGAFFGSSVPIPQRAAGGAGVARHDRAAKETTSTAGRCYRATSASLVVAHRLSLKCRQIRWGNCYRWC